MGRYIAALPPAARDRLIVGQRWIPGLLSDGEGGACLRGHAEGFAVSGMHQFDISRVRHSAEYRPGQFSAWHDADAQDAHWAQRGFDHVHRFNEAIRRWPERTVRAIKLRAARLNGTTPQEIARILAVPTPSTTNSEV